MRNLDVLSATGAALLVNFGAWIALYGVALVFVMHGGLKFASKEAEALKPLIGTSPLLNCTYRVASPEAVAKTLGCIEIVTGLLLALTPVAGLLGALGAAMATLALLITVTFLVTGPSWDWELGGFPALSPTGASISKDIALLGSAVAAIGFALGARAA
jgi:uncharacterized membrane protein YkgB